MKYRLNKSTTSDYEGHFSPSLTIPDQTLGIKEILQRYARGLPMDGKVPIYEGDEGDGIDPRRLDLSERAELQQMYTEELNQIKQNFESVKTKNTAPPRERGGGGGVDMAVETNTTD